MPRPREWFWLEVAGLVAALVGGAVLRYWLSTVVPFDVAEQALLADANDPERAMRVPFIMLNGLSLFALYVLVRRSTGVPAAFAVLLALQSSLTFQYEALRVRIWSPVALFALVALAWFATSLPRVEVPRKLRVPLGALAALFGLREVFLLATLMPRMAHIRQATSAEVAPLRASLGACGNEAELPLDRFRSCRVAWPESRSIDQQEVLWEHERRLGPGAVAVAAASAIPPGRDHWVALLDARGAGFIVVPEGPTKGVARRVLGLDPAPRAGE